MGSTAVVHSHRPTTKTKNKPFKSRHSTKGALRDLAKGRLPDDSKRKGRHQTVMSKIDRRNQSRQEMLKKQRARAKEVSVFSGRDAAPRIVAVIPLCPGSDSLSVVRSMNNSLDIESDLHKGSIFVPVDRFKQKLQYVAVDRDLSAFLDAARVADFLLFVLSAVTEVDELGELILRSIEGQGMSTMFTVVDHMEKIEHAKDKLSVVASLRSYISHFHPEQEKIYNLDNRQECANLMRSICTSTPKGVRWRDERSWMLVEQVDMPAIDGEPTCLTGVVRGKGLKADRLVQVGDWGTFQIEKIEAAPRVMRKKNTDQMNIDEETKVLESPTQDQDALEELAPPEILMTDVEDSMKYATSSVNASGRKKGVLVDDYHYFSDDETYEREMPKQLPRGTSAYQSAWFVGDENYSDSGSDHDGDEEDVDMDNNDENEPLGPQDGVEDTAEPEMTEVADATEYAKSVAFEEMDEDKEAQELEEYRAKKRDEAQEDFEFPDEIELHPNVIARERLLKYRGLKSLKDSPWDVSEDQAFEPEGWPRLLRFQDRKGAMVRATREALVGGVAPGTRVRVFLRAVPSELVRQHNPNKPITLFSLHRHEFKHTVLNFLISLPSDYPTSIKSKEEFIVQCGPRRFKASLVFSQSGGTPNDVHKVCRFLHPGQSAVASFIGPVTWGSVPTLFFRQKAKDTGTAEKETQAAAATSSKPLHLAATGTALPPSVTRVIAKRIILTGHPYHIHRKVVTVRYMFFNREDVQWFKALPLWTKRGRIGHIKEPLGTHGYFKALFNEKINPQDTIGVSLYKRVWPRSSVPWNQPLLSVASMSDADDIMVE